MGCQAVLGTKKIPYMIEEIEIKLKVADHAIIRQRLLALITDGETRSVTRTE